jgi:GT2 family glycosyltransferase
VEFAEAHPEVGLIGPCLRGADGRTQVSCRPRPTVGTFLHKTSLLRWTGLFRHSYRRYRREGRPGLGIPRRVETLMGAALLLPRQVFFTCGGWDEDYTFGGEDFDLSLRVGRHHELVYVPDVVITHYGRVSTRANVSYSAPNVAIGFARYLRKSGCSRSALLTYKLVTTLDVPVHLIGKGLQWLRRRCMGREAKARQSLQRIKEGWYFLMRGLREFWKV